MRSGRLGRCDSGVCENFTVRAVGVADEGGGNGPVLEHFRRRDRLHARIHATLVQALAIVGVQVELPEAVAVFDRTLLVVVLGELNLVTGFSRETDLGDAGCFDAMGVLTAA